MYECYTIECENKDCKCETFFEFYEEILCPEEDGDCPYYNIDSGTCEMEVMEGCKPFTECDAFYGLVDNEEGLM